MNDEPDDIDSLMNSHVLDELSTLPGTPGRINLDKIIAQQRKYRALREQGVKPKKPRSEAAPAVALAELLATMPKPEPTKPKRRF